MRMWLTSAAKLVACLTAAPALYFSPWRLFNDVGVGIDVGGKSPRFRLKVESATTTPWLDTIKFAVDYYP